MPYDDDEPKRPEQEGVRIIGAEEAAEALGRGDVAHRKGEAEPRFGDRPEAPDVDGPRPTIRFPLAAEVSEEQGTIQRFTPTIEALVCPDIDASLDDQAAKRAFWEAFKAIGPWWSELPPY